MRSKDINCINKSPIAYKKKQSGVRPNRYFRIAVSFFALAVGILWFLLGITSLFRLSTLGMAPQIYWDSLGGVGGELSPWAILIGIILAFGILKIIFKFSVGKVGFTLLCTGILLLITSIFVSWGDVNRVHSSINQTLGVKSLSDSKSRLTSMALPLKQDFSDLKRIADISYGPHGANNTLDLIMPSKPSQKKMPILLQVHGGGMTSGAKNMESMPLLIKMARSGWIVATINYRLGPTNRWPSQIHDVNQAILWLQKHGSEYGGDSNFIAGVGGSAGGYLLSLAALAPNNSGVSPLKAVVPLYAAYDAFKLNIGTENFKTNVLPESHREDKELFRQLSPIYHINADAPPFYIIHGELDGLAAIEDVREFVKQLRAVSKNTVVYTELAGAHHGFDNQNSLRVAGVNEGIQSFLEFQYARYLKTVN